MRYEDLIRSIEISNIRTRALRYNTSSAVSAETGVTINQQHTVRVSRRGERLFGLVHITVNGHSPDEPNPTDVFSFVVTLEVTYTLKEPLTIPRSMLKFFGDTNVIYNAWPYFRMLLQSATLDMGISPVIAPVLRRL